MEIQNPECKLLYTLHFVTMLSKNKFYNEISEPGAVSNFLVYSLCLTLISFDLEPICSSKYNRSQKHESEDVFKPVSNTESMNSNEE